MTRDVMITIADLTFTVAVTPDENNHGVRRWHTRICDTKKAIDGALDAGVLSEIDARIKRGEFEDAGFPAPDLLGGEPARVATLLPDGRMEGGLA